MGSDPTAPPIWRVGLMGTNANVETADRLLEAFDSVVESRPTALSTGGRLMAVRTRLHRSELAVPGSSTRMLEKAPNAGADVVFLDLEDAVAPDDKEQARENVIAALNEQDWSACSVSVRINGLDTHYCYRDIVEVVERAGDKLDTILIPKVGTPVGCGVRRHAHVPDRGRSRARADQPAHPDRDGAWHGKRGGDRPGLPRSARGDGVRRGRLRRVDPGPNDQYRRRQPRILGADRP